MYAVNLKGSDKVRAVNAIPKTEENQDQASGGKTSRAGLSGARSFLNLKLRGIQT